MSSSTQNDLELVETPQERVAPRPRDLSFTYPAEKLSFDELGIIKLTAQFCARYGTYFLRDLKRRVVTNSRFEFMNETSNMSGFFRELVVAYARVIKHSKKLSTQTALEGFFHRLQLEKLEKWREVIAMYAMTEEEREGVKAIKAAVRDLHVFVGGVDCFAHMDDEDYSEIMPPPQRLSDVMSPSTQMQPALLLQPPLGSPANGAFTFPAGITAVELGVIKLTAQFVARYGTCFGRELMERVVMNPWFDFMKPGDSRSGFFNGLVSAYEGVLVRFEKQSKVLDDDDDASSFTATALEAFFRRLQLYKLEKGSELAVIDLHAFVAGVDCFAHMDDEVYSAIMPPPPNFSMILK